jgi:SAM-dependent methyltransferase
VSAPSATAVAAWGGAVYARRLRAGTDAHCRLHLEDGAWRPLPLARWLGPVTAAEATLLDHARGPVLDVGCGPGRLVDALARRGVLALGIDESPDAVALARRRGAPALAQSIFGPVPSAGLWGSALLLDGNLGIGGDPVALLARLAALLRPGGTVLAEVDPPGWPTRRVRARLEDDADATAWFPWAVVGLDGLPAVAGGAGLRLRAAWGAAGRFFAVLA